jgi:WD40 repeat protein
VTASWDKTARVWNSSDGRLVATLTGHEEALWSAAFSPAGHQIVTASNDSTVRLWSKEGELLTILSVPEKYVRFLSAAFSPEGDRIITASSDDKARVWSIDGKVLLTLSGHVSEIRSATFSPDGARIVTASEDKTARIWKTFPTTQALIEEVKLITPRCLTAGERERLYLVAEVPEWCYVLRKWPNVDTAGNAP